MDIYSLIRNDHLELRILLDELMALEANDDFRLILIEQIENILMPHSRAEEIILYNSIRVLRSDTSDVMCCYQEHAQIETYLRALQVKEDSNLNWKETAEKLQTEIVNHIEQEEDVIFREAQAIFNEKDAQTMGKAFQKLKTRIEKEGSVRTSFDMVINLLPTKLVERMRELKTP